MKITNMTPDQLDASVVTDTNRLLSAAVGICGGMEVKHVKTGGLYVVLCEAVIEATMTKAVVYKSIHDGTVWVRPSSEFCDGRFIGV